MAARSWARVENLPSLISLCVRGGREPPTFRYVIDLLMSERPVKSDCCLLVWLLCSFYQRGGL